MKTTLRAKLLQHLVSKKKASEGFTLIELLVVIIIIGILAAIALPSFLNQANRARQTEAVTNIGAINRAQQAYILERDAFSRFIGSLGIGINVDSESYEFGQSPTSGTAANVGDILGVAADNSIAFNEGTAAGDDDQYLSGSLVYGAPKSPIKLKGYAGGTYLLAETTTGEVTSTTILCEEDQAGTNAQNPIVFNIAAANGLAVDPTCGANSSPK
ncbi:type IV pilin-like G/H family protein [Leptothoe sp. EHU-05/26/07-4]